MFVKLALTSLADRKGSVILSIIAMTISISVLLGVTHIRHQAKANFSSTVAGIDLIVGARTGSLNLLLYSVFGIGSPTDNLDWHAFEKVAAEPAVEWAVPISLGDSHKGYRVLGTTQGYFQHYRYGKQTPLVFAKGHVFDHVHDVVVGAEVAKQLNYRLGSKLTLAHGAVSTRFNQHKDYPFSVTGILATTGTPVDQSVIVSLESIDAIHQAWQHGTHIDHEVHEGEGKHDESHHQHEAHEHSEPHSITAALLGLKSKVMTLKMQREINQNDDTPLTAILPGVALTELWQVMRTLENTLALVSILVFVAACLGVGAMLFASIRERRQEIKLLRVIGASPAFLFILIEMEAIIITLLSMILAAGLLVCTLYAMRDEIISSFGLHIDINIFSQYNLEWLVVIMMMVMVVAAIPSFNLYRQGTITKNKPLAD